MPGKFDFFQRESVRAIEKQKEKLTVVVEKPIKKLFTRRIV